MELATQKNEENSGVYTMGNHLKGAYFCDSSSKYTKYSIEDGGGG